MRSAVRTSALVAALTLIAAACGGDDDSAGSGGDEPGTTSATESPATEDGASESSTAPEAPAGSACEATVPDTQVNYGAYSPVQSLDPILTTGGLAGGTELANIYDVLFAFDYETAEYEPKLAESIEPNDDFTVWTLHLREGMEFSDGTPLDAEAVVASLERYSGDDVRDSSASLLEMVEETTVVDDLTVEFRLSAPWSEFPHVLSRGPGMIVNVDAIDDPDAFGAQPPDAAGVGPFVVERNAPGEEVVMTARGDYWDGPVCLETLRFVFIPGAQATYDAFEAGELDVAFMRDDNVIQAALDNGDDGFITAQDSGVAINLNHRDGRPFADPRVRQAALLATDVETINDRAYQGKLATGKALIQEGSQYHSDAIEEPATDPEQARALLEEAKADGYDGKIELLCKAAPPEPDVALAAEGMLEAVGFEVEVSTIPVAEQIGQVTSGEFDAACWGVSFDHSSIDATILKNFHSESSGNRGGYVNPRMDEAIAEFLAAPDADARQAALAEINTIYTEDAVEISIGAPNEGIIHTPEVRGIRPTALTVFMFDDAHIAE